MTDLLEKAVRTARALPPKEQDDIARIMLMIAGEDQPVLELTPEEKASFSKSREQAARREFAADDQVQAVWNSVRPSNIPSSRRKPGPTVPFARTQS